MNEWKPTAKQTKFIAVPDSVKEGFYAGAVGAGKSDVLLLIPIIRKWHEHEGFKGLFLRRTFPELKNEIIPRSKHYYTKLGAKFNKNDKVWEFPSGALIFFGHCENEDDVHNYDSMQPNYVAFDELTSFTEFQYLYITLQRVRRTMGSNLPMIVRSASNPGNIGHNWVRKRFIDPAPDGNVLIEGKSGVKRIFIPATIDDNPHIDPTYRKSLEAIPDRAERDAKLFGKWDAYEGQVFEEFRDKRYPEEPNNAIHTIEPFIIPAFWPRIISIDWGYAPPAMTYVCYGAISPDSRLYIYREQAWQKTKIAEWGPYVREYVDSEKPRQIKLCQSAGQDRGQAHTIHGEISNELGYPVELTSNMPGSRIAGKMLIHEYLRWKQKPVITKGQQQPFSPEHAEWLLRNHGMREYQKYNESFIPEEEEKNIPKMMIFYEERNKLGCPMLIGALKSCVYDKTHPQDVAEFPGDDPYDALRYLVDAADRYFDECHDEHIKTQRIQELTTELETTKDWNRYYRKAEFLEKENESAEGMVVRRYKPRHYGLR
jgi:terminase large subunit-like protein